MILSSDEFLVVSGIQDYPRRIRELRVQLGWAIASGVTIKEMCKDNPEEIPDDLKGMKPSEYVLLHDKQDRGAAHRWHLANSIRKKRLSVRDKIGAAGHTKIGIHQTLVTWRFTIKNHTRRVEKTTKQIL